MATSLLKRFKMLLMLAMIVGIIASYAIYQSISTAVYHPLELDEPVSIVFKPGSSSKTLANQLKSMSLLEHPWQLRAWTKLHRLDTRLQAGEYMIDDGQSIAALLDLMVAGKVKQHTITFIEGTTFREIRAVMDAHPVLDKVLTDLDDEAIMEKLGFPGEHPEGRFYPDTYHFSRGMSDFDLLQRAHRTMQETLDEEWQNREQDLPLKSAYEALTLASIVEKESAVPEERPLIAGVFINRLRKNMRLQTDPTVIYGIEDYDGDIRFKDLRKDTPYNTYTRHGLPPTPIAMPGREAIHATLHPEKTQYLYFVAYGDNSGRHVFSTNLEDHEKAVDQYQRKK
jgi:UPF0755 protein